MQFDTSNLLKRKNNFNNNINTDLKQELDQFINFNKSF